MAIGAGIASTGLQIFKTIKQSGEAKALEDRIANFNRRKLVNSAKDISISTLASEQETEANLSRFATSIEMLQRGGDRTVKSNLPRLSEGNILLQNKISADLGRQDERRSFAIARGEDNIQNIINQRENQALLGLGQELQNKRQGAQDSLGSLFGSVLSLDRLGLFGGDSQDNINALFKTEDGGSSFGMFDFALPK